MVDPLDDPTGNNLCPPGHYRNTTTGLGSYAPSDPLVSSVLSTSVIFPCAPCPSNTYKVGDGDGMELCRACPSLTSRSDEGSVTCECFRIGGGGSFVLEEIDFDRVLEECVSTSTPLPQGLPHGLPRGLAVDSHHTKSEQFVCPPGHYCKSGVRYKCPTGRYGGREGETEEECEGDCEEGYYCPRGSAEKTGAGECGAVDVYCPRGSGSPVGVQEGYYTTFGDGDGYGYGDGDGDGEGSDKTATEGKRDGEVECGPGEYCVEGRRYKCARGHYGAGSGNVEPTCDGMCSRGYFCQEGR